METVRTPDERFENLPDFPYAPRYVEIPDGEGGRLRVHYVEEGNAQAELIVLMHGQPSWSFLYRKMIPILVAAGHRVIAPDLIGFGRSDKPTERSDYSYSRQVAWMTSFYEALDLRDATLYCQDWGSLIGLRIVADQPERFARVVVANGALPDGSGGIPKEHAAAGRELYASLPVVDVEELGARFRDKEGPPGFLYWRKFCAETTPLPIGEIFRFIEPDAISEQELAAYEAPFPDERYKAAPHIFPSFVPIFGDDPEVEKNQQAWQALARFGKPFQTAFSDHDPVTAGGEKLFQERIAGAQGVEHVTIQDAGHFLQQDQGEQCAEALLRFVRAHPFG